MYTDAVRRKYIFSFFIARCTSCVHRIRCGTIGCASGRRRGFVGKRTSGGACGFARGRTRWVGCGFSERRRCHRAARRTAAALVRHMRLGHFACRTVRFRRPARSTRCNERCPRESSAPSVRARSAVLSAAARPGSPSGPSSEPLREDDAQRRRDGDERGARLLPARRVTTTRAGSDTGARTGSAARCARSPGRNGLAGFRYGKSSATDSGSIAKPHPGGTGSVGRSFTSGSPGGERSAAPANMEAGIKDELHAATDGGMCRGQTDGAARRPRRHVAHEALDRSFRESFAWAADDPCDPRGREARQSWLDCRKLLGRSVMTSGSPERARSSTHGT